MKTLINKIGKITGEGVNLDLTEPAVIGRGLKSKRWFVSWDAIGKALFKEQYSSLTSVKELRAKRGE